MVLQLHDAREHCGTARVALQELAALGSDSDGSTTATLLATEQAVSTASMHLQWAAKCLIEDEVKFIEASATVVLIKEHIHSVEV